MKVLVTGATGFIGAAVLAALATQDVEVIAAGRRASTLRSSSHRTRMVELDVSTVHAGTYEQLGRPDVLIHLAWGGLPNYTSSLHYESELPIQYRFVKTLVESGLPAVTVTGTCLEYGIRCGALRETFPTDPGTPYGFAKDALRRQLEFLQSERAFALTWLRLFYTYGSGQAPTSLYAQLQDAIRRGDSVFRMSGGEQLRDYLPIDELVRLLAQLALKRTNAGIVNLCSGRPVSVRNLVEGWVRTQELKIELEFGVYPYPSYEPMAFWGDRAKLDSLLEAR